MNGIEAYEAFILPNGNINPSSSDGTGEVRVSSSFTNAIGFNGITPDRDDSIAGLQFVVSSANNINVLSDIDSDARITFDTSIGGNDVAATTDNGAFITPFIEVNSDYGGLITSNEFFFIMNDTGNVFSTKDNSIFWQRAGDNADILRASLNTAGAWTSEDLDAIPVTISSRNATVNQNITNSAIAGGVGLTADQDDTLFAQELRFNAALNGGDVITSIGSDVTLTILDDYFSITPDNNGFNEGWVEVTNDIASFSYGNQTGGDFVAELNRATISNTGVVILDSQLTGNTLGTVAGETVIQNDVTDGLLEYLVDPTTTASWGARSIPDRNFVTTSSAAFAEIDTDITPGITGSWQTVAAGVGNNKKIEVLLEKGGGGAAQGGVREVGSTRTTSTFQNQSRYTTITKTDGSGDIEVFVGSGTFTVILNSTLN